MTIESFMKEKGFASGSSGGGCQWYTKEFTYKGKPAFLAITDNGGLDLPISLGEPVIAGVYDMETGEIVEEPKLFESIADAIKTFHT